MISSRALTLIAIVSLLALSCKSQHNDKVPDKPVPGLSIPFEAQYDIHNLNLANEFEKTGVSRGEVISINEASGLANSRSNPGYLWTHEDSGTDNVVYLPSKTKGQVVATYRLKNAQNIDWEDMAIGPGPQVGTHYLYIADIGDNNAVRSDLSVYRVPEPLYQSADSRKVVDLNNVEKLKIAYPDSAHDAEAFLIDPLTRDMFIITKKEDRVLLYQSPYPQHAGVVDTLRYIGSFPFTGITAGDISEDGKRVLLKSYTAIFYWEKEGEELLINLLYTTPKRAPYDPVEFQGEAICWDVNSYFTLSEKVAGFVPKLYFYKAK